MFDILYQDSNVLIIQTHAGQFDKWGDDVYGQFNVALHVGDDPHHVLQNRMALLEKLCKLTCHRISQIHWLNQIHSAIVIPTSPNILPPDGDALISDKSGVGLGIMTADCVPIALFNDDQIACIHAGWQGLTQGIIKATHDKFRHQDIKALIGACISQDNYEVTQSLAQTIVQSIIDKRLVSLGFDELYRAVVSERSDQKCKLNVVKLARLQLEHLGITVINETVPCSYEMPHLYSYRQQTHAKKSATGRMAMVMIKL